MKVNIQSLNTLFNDPERGTVHKCTVHYTYCIKVYRTLQDCMQTIHFVLRITECTHNPMQLHNVTYFRTTMIYSTMGEYTYICISKSLPFTSYIAVNCFCFDDNSFPPLQKTNINKSSPSMTL